MHKGMIGLKSTSLAMAGFKPCVVLLGCAAINPRAVDEAVRGFSNVSPSKAPVKLTSLVATSVAIIAGTPAPAT